MRQDSLFTRCLALSLALHVGIVLGVPLRQHLTRSLEQAPRTIRFPHVKLISQPKPPPAQASASKSDSDSRPAARRATIRRVSVRRPQRRVVRRVRRVVSPRPEKVLSRPVQIAKEAAPKRETASARPREVAKAPAPAEKPKEVARAVEVRLMPPPKEKASHNEPAGGPQETRVAAALKPSEKHDAPAPGGAPPAPASRPLEVGGAGIQPDKPPTGDLPKSTPQMQAALPGSTGAPGSSGRPAGPLTPDTTGPVAAAAPAAGSGGGKAPGPPVPGPTMVALGPKIGLAPGAMPGPGNSGLPFAGPGKQTPGMGSLDGPPGVQVTLRPAPMLAGLGDGGYPAKPVAAGTPGLPGAPGARATQAAGGSSLPLSGGGTINQRVALGGGLTENPHGTTPVPSGKISPTLGPGSGGDVEIVARRPLGGGGGTRIAAGPAGGGGGDGGQGGDGGPVGTVGSGGGSGLAGVGGFAQGTGSEPGVPGIPGTRLALAGGGGGGVPGNLIGYGEGGNGGGVKATPGMLALGPLSLPGTGGKGPGGGQGGTGGVGMGEGGGVGDGIGPVAVGGSGPPGQGGLLVAGGPAGPNVALGIPSFGQLGGGGGGFGGFGGGDGVGGPGIGGVGPGGTGDGTGTGTGGGGGYPNGAGDGTGIGKAVPGGGPLILVTGPGGAGTGGRGGMGGGTGSGIGSGPGDSGPVAVIAQGLANLGLQGAATVPGALGGIGTGAGVSLADAGMAPGAGSGGGGTDDKARPGGLYVDVSGTFDLPRGVASTDYGADAHADQNLLAEVRNRTNIHVTVTDRQVPLNYDEIANLPILQIRGHRPFSFTPEQRESIRKYVLNGGTIFGEDSHGPFGECFRREMKLIFGQDMSDLPSNHPLYRSYYVLKSIPAGDMGERYPLRSINIGKRAGVIFSRNDYGGCWDGTGGWVKPETREPAFQMGVNLYAYVVAHWNQAKGASAPPQGPRTTQ